MNTSRITHLEAVIKDLEAQVENYQSDAYVLSLLTQLDESEKHNQELRDVNARHVRMLSTIIPLPEKWMGKPTCTTLDGQNMLVPEFCRN